MKILMVNKFLYHRGGAETYTFELGAYQESIGHELSYFGMADRRNIYSNRLKLEVSEVEFRTPHPRQLLYPFRIISSSEARQKIAMVLDDFKPDYVHINNINFQITPSILYEIKKRSIPIIQTLHDYQNICPNHMLYIEHKKQICEQCQGHHFTSCIKNRCVHHSIAKSIIGAIESWYYHSKNTYDLIDAFVCPSQFLADKMKKFGFHEERLHVIHNFIQEPSQQTPFARKDYGIYFGRLSIQKGIGTLIQAMSQLPQVNFILAGGGELEKEIGTLGLSNVKYVGFQSGEPLMKLIGEAAFSILPTEWYENCPMSVLESLMLGTPVIASAIGGVPELIRHEREGLLFTPGNVEQLKNSILQLSTNRNQTLSMSQNAKERSKEFSLQKYQRQLSKVIEPILIKR